MSWSPTGPLNPVSFGLNLAQASLTQEWCQHGRDREALSIGRKTLPRFPQRLEKPRMLMFQCGAIGDAHLGFSQNNSAHWRGNPLQFLEELGPERRWEKSDQPSMHQIKGVVREV